MLSRSSRLSSLYLASLSLSLSLSLGGASLSLRLPIPHLSTTTAIVSLGVQIMVKQAYLITICSLVGVVVGIFLTSSVFLCTRWWKRRSNYEIPSTENGLRGQPLQTNGIHPSIESSLSFSNPVVQLLDDKSPRSWWNYQKDRTQSASGILRYLYKDLQKATQNFTTLLGQGSFGPVYKAAMATGGVVAVKVLASNSKQGEKEFQTEVSLLGRLHHRNLVNLVGYCVDKGQHMLIYEYMSNGSLESHLYGNDEDALTWDGRLQIALDISHGIEYLHEGAVPPVVHRDLKCANILLDHSMRAKVADFGLSKEEHFDGRASSLKGTYGYMDPAYISSSKLSVKSDIYSFGVIIFELITSINPQQNLMDYVNLAAMDLEGVDEILDKRLVGKCNIGEVRELAKVGYKCLHKNPRKRPSIGEVSQAILKIKQKKLAKEANTSFSGDDISRMVSRIESQQVELSRRVMQE
ncbi:hypothetical protein V2J09_011006 [Rumex salicifolius]